MQNAVGLFGEWNQVMERVDAECSMVIWRMKPSDGKSGCRMQLGYLDKESSDGKSGCRMQLGYLEEGTK